MTHAAVVDYLISLPAAEREALLRAQFIACPDEFIEALGLGDQHARFVQAAQRRHQRREAQRLRRRP